MKNGTGFSPAVGVAGGGRQVVSQAGAVLLVETIRKAGLDRALSAALVPWRKPRAVHDPGKILLDVALAVAVGGDCLADVAMLRAEPGVFGPVARIRRSPAWSTRWLRPGRRRWMRCAGPVPRCVSACGD